MEHPHGHQAQAQKTRASLAKIVISTDETQIMKTSKANILAANSETKHVRWNAEVTLGCKVRFSHGSTINRWLPSAQARLLKTAFSKNPPGEVTHRAADTFAPLRQTVATPAAVSLPSNQLWLCSCPSKPLNGKNMYYQ